jgi:spoIIIJ-associated protein
MSEVHQQAEELLNEVFAASGFDLRASQLEVDSQTRIIEVDGSDAPLLRNESGELLDSLESLINQIFSRSLPSGERIVCDVGGFRALREAELRAMARHAAERVRTSGLPFTFGAMNANERRVIHVSLADEADLSTESVGEGSARRLMISKKSATT